MMVSNTGQNLIFQSDGIIVLGYKAKTVPENKDKICASDRIFGANHDSSWCKGIKFFMVLSIMVKAAKKTSPNEIRLY
ncbi:hypothetical protein ACM5Q9_01855 [Advenella sp. RU8]|uniref:hypothetical protein n=1 Tax=Advenella sp. RU8 TaxID=3399575 RepID=UPI003AAC5539